METARFPSTIPLTCLAKNFLNAFSVTASLDSPVNTARWAWAQDSLSPMKVEKTMLHELGVIDSQTIEGVHLLRVIIVGNR
jgi:hypothetical protein